MLITFYRCSTDVLAAGLLHHVYDIIFTWDSTNLKQQEGIDFLIGTKKPGWWWRSTLDTPLPSGGSCGGRSCGGRTFYICLPRTPTTPTATPFSCSCTKSAGYKPNILFRSSDTESVLVMVAAEEGISILPDYCTDKLYHADNLVFRAAGGGR